jgi:VanZ family protein
MALIFFMSHQPGGESGAFSRMVLEFLASCGFDLRSWFGDHAFWVVRKAAHFSEYFILYFLVAWALAHRTIVWPKTGYMALSIAILYAASDEVHQLFIPKRVGDIVDVGIDSLGALFAISLHALARKATHSPTQLAVSREIQDK